MAATRLVRQLKGFGTVYRGDVQLGPQANYRIDIYREFIDSGIGGSEIPGMFSLEGVIEDHGLPIGEPLKLATAQFIFEFWVKDSRGTMMGNGFTDPQGKPLSIESVP